MQVVERSNYTVAKAITGGDGVDQLWNRRGGPTADWHACHGFVALIPFDIFVGIQQVICQRKYRAKKDSSLFENMNREY